MILALLDSAHLTPPLSEDHARPLAIDLGRLGGMQVYPRSIAAHRHALFFLGQRGREKLLGILASDAGPSVEFVGQSSRVTAGDRSLLLTICPTADANAAALRKSLSFLAPRILGLRKSVGCGDRLGLATPGHVRAVRRSGISPIFAQQSMRENARTGRNPQQVVDEATWGVLQEGWCEGFGADADHLKSTADIDLCAAAGYTFYTFDPGEYVENQASKIPSNALERMAEALPWSALESTPDDLRRRLADKPLDLGTLRLTVGWEELLRAAIKYSRAVAHTVGMYRHLAQRMGAQAFELEMSVDETETVTTLAEHVYIAHELRRLEVRWVSLAPRYVGTFEKGVDYIGALAEFESSFAGHLAVARTFGPYKLSLHSGSDKFSIYPIVSRLAGELVHLKTAGTSYLEALRAIAALNPGLFREIVTFAVERYPTDRASYHVSADPAGMPDMKALSDNQLPALLNDFHGREVLHVTFGSVLKDLNLSRRMFTDLRNNEEAYYQILEDHFMKHLAPFGR